MKKFLNFDNFLKHPLVVAIIIAILFNISISNYSHNTTQNNTMIQLGFIPSKQDYEQCINSINQVGNDYYNIYYEAGLINKQSPKYNDNTEKFIEIMELEDALEHFETKANTAYTNQLHNCDNAYTDLEFTSQILHREKSFNEILKQRNAAMETILSKENFIHDKLDKLKATSLAKFNSEFLPKNPYASNAQIWTFKAKNLYGINFIKIYNELLLLQYKRLKIEKNYYSLVKNMLKQPLIERLHKNIWHYIL